MDFIVKFTIGLFIFSILLLFFKSTKKLSENYYEKSIMINNMSREQEKTLYNPNTIKFKIRNLE